MEKKKRYNYIKKEIARGSYPAAGADAVSVCLLVAAIRLSVHHMGNGPLLTGALGCASLVAALWSLYFVFGALRDENKNFLVAKIAGGVAGVLLLFWGIIVLAGILG